MSLDTHAKHLGCWHASHAPSEPANATLCTTLTLASQFAHCTRHESHDSGSIPSKVLLAEALLLNEQYEAAIAQYKAVLEADAHSKEGREGLAQAEKLYKRSKEIDYYKLLKVKKGCSDKELKKAYREAAKKYHPDKNVGDEQAAKKFALVAKAYEVLSDPEQKRIYDLGGGWFQQQSGGSPFGGGFGGGGGSPFGGGGNPFASMFGGGGMPGFGGGGGGGCPGGGGGQPMPPKKPAGPTPAQKREEERKKKAKEDKAKQQWAADEAKRKSKRLEQKRQADARAAGFQRTQAHPRAALAVAQRSANNP